MDVYVRGWVGGCEAYVIITLKGYHAFFFKSSHMYYLLIVFQFVYRKSYTFKTSLTLS